MDPLFSIEGRVAIVTGASSGLGRHFVEQLVDRGARVVAVGRRAHLLTEMCDALGPRVLAVTADVVEESAAQTVIDQALEWAGSIDILVNSAGITSVQPAEEETPSIFRKVMEVNVMGTYNFCYAVGRKMLEQGKGVIFNIASINGIVASWTIPEAGYCASKGAVISLTRELAAQWAERGVRVNAIAPGYFPTEMTEGLFETEAGSRRLRQLPMRRGGELDELTGPLIFLASDASSYVTGQAIVVDGGWTIV